MQNEAILLVEDNEGDIMLVTEALEDLNIQIDLNVVCDGEKALDYLMNKCSYTDAVTPDLILLDINIPKINGLEVLKKLKQNEATKSIPVIMLTTSSSQKDVAQAYKNYANCYIVKPDDAEGLIETIKAIENFWFSCSEIPSKKKN